MGLKKNIFYNSFMTAGLYLSQVITFPYVTRVLGAEKLGTCNFVQSYVQFFLLVSALGVSSLGVREIAKSNNSKELLNDTFSRLFTLTAATTIIAFLLYLIIGLAIPQLSAHPKLFWIGAFNILFHLFLIEWFYRGIEEFKYIACRTLIVRVAYVVFVFVLIKNENDYVLYSFLLLITIIINSSVNWIYSKRWVKFKISSLKKIGNLWKPHLLIGFQLILLGYNVTINPMLLGFISDNTEVGYYTTASKLIYIILLFYNAYTLVMLPRLSSMIGSNMKHEADVLIKKSYSLLYLLAIPIMVLFEIYVPEIIYLVAGSGYVGAILPMRVALPVILIGGISQITINQVLIPNNMERTSLYATIAGVLSSIILSCCLIPTFQSTASSIAWLAAEVVISAITIVYAKRQLKGFSINLSLLMKYIVIFLPLALLYYVKNLVEPLWIQIIITIVISMIYTHLTLYYCTHDECYTFMLRKILKNNKQNA